MGNEFDLVVVGGGAAGLAAAQYGARANLRTLLVEEMAPGGQALLIDKLENYPGLAGPISGYEFSETMRVQAESFGAEFLTASASSLRREGGRFELATSEGKVFALAVVLATGARHRRLGVPGEAEFSGRGVSYCATCDGPFFKGKRIFVVGGGDAACDEAMYLANLSDKVVMVHRRDRFRAQKSLAARVLANPRIEVRFQTVIAEIRGDTKVGSVLLERMESCPVAGCKGTGEFREESADAVFVFVGSDPQTALAPDARKDETGSILTDEGMATSVPGLFAAGDVRTTPFRQLVTACADGAVAAHSASKYIDELRGSAYV
jgi:thioredoxin reductase (NADPH)